MRVMKRVEKDISQSVTIRAAKRHGKRHELIVFELVTYPTDSVIREHDELWSQKDEEKWLKGIVSDSIPSEYSLDTYLRC